MEDVYPKAYKEAYVILHYMPKEDFEKIPSDVINMFKANMDKDYEYDLDKTKPFEEQTMLKQTKELLAILFRDYWANPEQKERIIKKLNADIKHAEEKKREQYNPDKIFKTQEKEIPKERALIENNKNKWYNRVFDFIKNIFKKKGG